MTFKDLGTDDLGIYSCDVTDTDGIASSYLIDEEGKFKIRALLGLMLLQFSCYHQVTLVLVGKGLSYVSPYRNKTSACPQSGAQVPK